MKKIIQIVALVIGALLAPAVAHGSLASVYVAQTAAGSGNGTSCANAEAATFFNTSGNWGSGGAQIGAGTTVNLCGTITTNLTAHGSGASGNPITILFDAGANLTQSGCGGPFLTMTGLSYIVVNGGTNGIIQNTSCGTAGTHGTTQAIVANPCANCTVENLTIANIYVHSGTGAEIDQTQSNCIVYSGDNFTVSNNVMHDVGWCLYDQGTGVGNVISGNQIYNVDHGIIFTPACCSADAGPIYIYNNYVHDYANWDDSADAYHHDGMHCYTVPSPYPQPSGNPVQGAHMLGLWIYNNHFDGNPGNDATSQIFLEPGTQTDGTATPCFDATSQIHIFGNFITGNTTDGIFQMGRSSANPFTGTLDFFNNTIFGSSAASGESVLFADISDGILKNNIVGGSNNLWSGDIPFGALDYNGYINCPTGTSFNCWPVSGGTNSFSTWQSGCSCDAHGVNSQANDGDVNQTTGALATGSPMIAAGTNLASAVASWPTAQQNALFTDQAGNPRSSTWDIGAFSSITNPTLTLNDASTYVAHRLGMNMGIEDYYSSYLLKNLIQNPGFEGYIGAITQIVAAGATTVGFTSTNGCDQVTTNWWAGGTYRVAYSATAGLTGATGTITSNTGPNNSPPGSCVAAPSFVISATTGTLQAGDVVETYISGPLTNCTFNTFAWDCQQSGSGSATVDTVSGDQFPGSAGTQNIKFTLTSGSDTADVHSGFDTNTGSGPGQGPNYFFNGTYTFSVKTWLKSGSGATITFSGARQTSGCSFSQSVTPTSTPQTQSITFTCSESAGSPPVGSLQFYITDSGTGANEVLIDDASLTSNADTNASAYRNQVETNMVSTMHVGSMRLWDGQNGSNFANETATQFGRKIAYGSTQPAPWPPPFTVVQSLYDFLEAHVAWGIPRAEFVIPMTDIWNLNEYVDFLNGACGGSAGADVRCALGQTTPFGSLLSDIELSLGNEVWNASAGGQYIPFGAYPAWVYSNIVSSACTSAKADANWSSVLKCNATVLTGTPSYGTFTNADNLEQNQYYADETITDSANPDQWIAEWTFAWASANDCTSGGPEHCQSYAFHPSTIYEGQNNVGSTTGGQSSLNGFANGFGSGMTWPLAMAWLQEKFQMPQYNFFTQFQNVFGVGGGLNNFIWGAFTGPGGIWNNPRPTAQGIGVLNQCIGTGETGIEVTPSGVPTYNFSGINGIPAESNVPLVQAFGFKSSGSRCIAIFNLDTVSHTLNIAGTNTPTGSCATTTFSSAHLTDNNESSLVVQPSSNSASCASSITIPSYSFVTENWNIGGGIGAPVGFAGTVTLHNIGINK